MTIYSEQLNANDSSSGGDVIFTAPAGVTTVVRDLELTFEGDGPSTSLISLFSESGSRLAYLGIWTAESNHTSFQWQGRAVMVPGQYLQLDMTVPSWLFWLSGYELS